MDQPAIILFLDGERGQVATLDHRWPRSGRLRLTVPGLRGTPAVGRRLEERLRYWPGVLEVTADARSGRLLLRHGPDSPVLSRLQPRREPEPATNRRKTRPSARGYRRGPRSRSLSAAEETWHALASHEVLRRLETSPEGLPETEAARRIRKYGDNLIEQVEARSRLATLADQVLTVPTGLLLGSAGVSLALGQWADAAAIVAVVSLDATIGYVVERRSEAILASWHGLEAGSATVVREGELRTIPAHKLVPGDVLLCRTGDRVPADARILEAHHLSCDESPLTGESEPQPKDVHPVPAVVPLAERSSMLHAGTSVATGYCRAVVTATGSNTQVGRIQGMVEEAIPPEAPISRKLSGFVRRSAVASVGGATLAAAAGLARGRPVADVVRGGVALALAAIPEGLPVVSTSALVRSMRRMRRHGVVVRRLAVAETLGGVTILCADKTGTLTLNQMTLEVLDVGGGELDPRAIRARPDAILEDAPTLALAAAVLNSEVDIQHPINGGGVGLAGSSTEQALVRAALAAGLRSSELRRTFPRLELHPRTARRQYVVSLHRNPDGGRVAFVKGAPEQVLQMCDASAQGPLDPEARARVEARNAELAARGLRVLALGWRRLDGEGEATLDGGYTFIGLAGLRDTLRPGAGDAIRAAAHAGVRALILTGDQRATAEATARQVGLRGKAIDLSELGPLESLDPAGIRALLAETAVLARVSPADKLAIVRALQRAGHIVAMVGDGINDAPALKAADVGLAVGVTSSDMARQVADAVVAVEDLGALLSVVGEGRIVQDNLRRAINFLFATNFSELVLVLGAALVGVREPLTPLQLLWINLLTDTLPALALALEPGRPELLDRPPAPPDLPLLTRPALRRVLFDGTLLAGLAAAGLALGGTPLAFSALVAGQISYATVCRAPGAAPRPRFVELVGASACLQLTGTFLPPVRRLLGLPGQATAIELAGLAVGALLPWLAGPFSTTAIVRRPGDTAAPARIQP